MAAFPTIAILAVRALGWMQPVEWTALDIYFQLRPTETVDNRIVIVGFEEKDIAILKSAEPLSDELLAQLLTKIKQQKPRVIGLDFYRNVPVGKGYPQLAQVFKTTPNLIGIEKVIGDKYYPTIAPPPVLEQLNQVAAVDTVEDGDGVVRRALLFLNNQTRTLGVALALSYLAKEGIAPKTVDDCCMKIKDTIYRPLQENAGSYVRTDSDGYQVLLNYRNPNQSFTRVSITDILAGKKFNNLMRDRIVLIGRTSPSFNDDKFSTPYSWNLRTTPIEISGVEVQAQIASQIVSSALDNRPIIKTLNEQVELLWMISWSLLITILARKWWHTSDSKNLVAKFFLNLISSSLAAAVAVISISYLAFLWGWWIPVVPSFLALTISPLLISTYTYIIKLNERQRNLEVKVAERTQELEQSMTQLKNIQEQLITQSKLASLGTLMAGIAHEINNPLSFVIYFTDMVIQMIEKLQLEIEQEYEYLPIAIIENFEEIITGITPNITDIKSQAKRIELTIQSMTFSADRPAFPSQPININELIESTIKVVSYSLQYKYSDFDVKLITEYDNSIGQVNFIAQYIYRALINIIDNACQAAYEKSLTEQVLKPEVKIKTKNLAANDSVEITVQDNGAGIPQNILDKIFDPFFTTKTPDKGTGIGLYFAYELIVNRHKGQIGVNSQSGIGTIFTVVLPKNVEVSG
ncbi:CHASE2 domain-containing protein [Synechocystis sp. PCC 7509]|uniref:CHASE2 domain-containing protein n=1 Tax=Synechocystis sp. PCC 7509 TaxID=927677 RepID=UPI00130D84BF|nr:CHASE2 domain-containing protein [Synechocystis sp. PCC 7509]